MRRTVAAAVDGDEGDDDDAVAAVVAVATSCLCRGILTTAATTHNA